MNTTPSLSASSNLPQDLEQFTRLQALLSQIRYFEALPLDVQIGIEAIARPRHFDANQMIYLEGEPAKAVYLLERGWVKATRTSREGREQAMLFLKPGEVFGDIAVFTGTPYPGTVMALEDVDVWVLPAQKFLDLVTKHSALALAVICRLGERVQHFIGLAEDLSLRSVEARLARTLLQHAEAQNGALVVLRRPWTTFDEMAIRLGTVRDVLSRALKTLEAEGLLKVERQVIVLLDLKGLEERGNL